MGTKPAVSGVANIHRPAIRADRVLRAPASRSGIASDFDPAAGTTGEDRDLAPRSRSRGLEQGKKLSCIADTDRHPGRCRFAG